MATGQTADGPSDRRAALERIARNVADRRDVADAFVAKSFTDLLVVVDAATDHNLPAIQRLLADEGLRPADDVYGSDDEKVRGTGPIEDGHRYRFVDVETSGDHQSYVVE